MLAIIIRENKEIKGTKIEQEETKLLQYADDTTAVLSDLNLAQYLFQQLGFFKTLSGLDIYNSKTEGLWIGSLGKGIKPLGIKWPSEPIKALGVVFIYDQRLLYEKNFQDRIDSMKKLTNIWSSRRLFVYGRVAIIKSQLISKLVYTFESSFIVDNKVENMNWKLERKEIKTRLKPRANALDLSTVQALNMLSVCWGVVERGVQMTSTMTQHVEHSEDFTKAQVESCQRIWGIFISSEHENACLYF